MRSVRLCPYAVGDIYITTNSVAPSTIWPGTQWSQIKDVFLIAAGDTYAAGSTGGSSSHSHTTGDCTLTTAHLPKHTHVYSRSNDNSNGSSLSNANLPKLGGNMVFHGAGTANGTNFGNVESVSGYTQIISVEDKRTKFRDGGTVGNATSYGKAHFVFGGGTTHAHAIGRSNQNTGDGGFANNAHNHGRTSGESNIPPYMAVYQWLRTA